MPDLSVTVPEEPADRSAVLDHSRVAWQRVDDLAPPDQPERRWLRVGATRGLLGFGYGLKSWPHLVVDSRELALLVPADEVDGWQRAGYRDPLAEHLPGPVPGQPGAPTPDDRPTRAAPDPETRHARHGTDELGGELREPPVDHVPPRDPRRPVVDRPQA